MKKYPAEAIFSTIDLSPYAVADFSANLHSVYVCGNASVRDGDGEEGSKMEQVK